MGLHLAGSVVVVWKEKEDTLGLSFHRLASASSRLEADPTDPAEKEHGQFGGKGRGGGDWVSSVVGSALLVGAEMG